jgi:hypothetical protein
MTGMITCKVDALGACACNVLTGNQSAPHASIRKTTTADFTVALITCAPRTY